MRAAFGVGVAAVMFFACTKKNIRECEGDLDCDYEEGGVCRANPATGNQWCSFPDDECPSGYSWGDVTIGDDLAGTCVDNGTVVVDADTSVPCDPRITWERQGDGMWTSTLDATDQHPVNAAAEISIGEWSPSGDLLVYSREGALWLVDRDGSSPRPITTGTGNNTRPTWSPDGTRLAFEHVEDGEHTISYVETEVGGAPIPLASGTDPTWAPSGEQLAFRRDDDIFTMDSDGFDESNLTNSASIEESPRWSPDGTLILFTSSADGSNELWTIRPDGLEASNLETGMTQGVWSPDGAVVMGVLMDELTLSIYVVNADGTGFHELIGDPEVLNTEPRFSPDGLYVAWSRFAGPNFDDADLWIAHADGSVETRITTGPAIDTSARWQGCPQ